MEGWQIYLVASGLVAFIIGWILLWFKMRKWGIKVVAPIILAFAIIVSVPTVLIKLDDKWDRETRDREWAVLVDAFDNQYPQDRLVDINKSEFVYIVYRTNGSNEVLVSALLGGVWVDFGKLNVPVEP